MKSILIVLGIIVIGGGVWYGIQTKPDTSVPVANVGEVNSETASNETKVNEEKASDATSKKEVDNANVKISFKGFGPGKVHNGSFTKVDSKLVFTGDDLKGEVNIDMNSLTSDNSEKLTPHLKSADFFDVAKYPTATFKLSSVSGGKATGKLTAHGVTKDVSFPITQTDTEYKATFNIDMKEFGIDQKFANEVVELSVTVPLK